MQLRLGSTSKFSPSKFDTGLGVVIVFANDQLESLFFGHVVGTKTSLHVFHCQTRSDKEFLLLRRRTFHIFSCQLGFRFLQCQFQNKWKKQFCLNPSLNLHFQSRDCQLSEKAELHESLPFQNRRSLHLHLRPTLVLPRLRAGCLLLRRNHQEKS